MSLENSLKKSFPKMILFQSLSGVVLILGIIQPVQKSTNRYIRPSLDGSLAETA